MEEAVSLAFCCENMVSESDILYTVERKTLEVG